MRTCLFRSLLVLLPALFYASAAPAFQSTSLQLEQVFDLEYASDPQIDPAGALQLQKVESVMVRIPGAGHGIIARPSNLMSKVAHILEWFRRYR